MTKDITSNEWHLRGVSLDVRKLVAAYSQLNGVEQGAVVDLLLRQSPELRQVAALLKSPKRPH